MGKSEKSGPRGMKRTNAGSSRSEERNVSATRSGERATRERRFAAEEDERRSAAEEDDLLQNELDILDIDKKMATLMRGLPPKAVSFQEYRDNHCLNATGLNPHKHGVKHDITDTALVEVFGQKKDGKSRFYFNHLKDPALLTAIHKYYKNCYSKDSLPACNLIGKDLPYQLWQM